MPEKVIIAGGSGMVGSHLTELLKEEGYQVAILSRKKSGEKNGVQYFQWNPLEGEIDQNALADADHIINLTGRNLNDKRWTEAFKNELYCSRVESTRFLLEKVKEQQAPVKSWANASAVGYYGFDRSEKLTEESASGDDFLARICRDWEEEAQKISELNIRLGIFRIGVVLAPEKSALQQMEMPVRYWAGAPISPGDQVVPWIHVEDLCKMLLFFLKNADVKGTFNAVAPQPATNEELMRKIAEVEGKPMFMPTVPKFALKMLLGEAANLVTGNLNISSKKIQSAGFQFKYTEVKGALKDLLVPEKEGKA